MSAAVADGIFPADITAQVGTTGRGAAPDSRAIRDTPDIRVDRVGSQGTPDIRAGSRGMPAIRVARLVGTPQERRMEARAERRTEVVLPMAERPMVARPVAVTAEEITTRLRRSKDCERRGGDGVLRCAVLIRRFRG